LFNERLMDNELTLLIGKGEKILYAGKPDKTCFIFECIFNPLLPFAVLWGLFDMFFIGAAFSSDKADEAAFFIVPFMALHLMPVWIYLGGALLSFRRYRNTAYIVTDKESTHPAVSLGELTSQSRLRNFRMWTCIAAFLISGLAWAISLRPLLRLIPQR